MVVGAQRARAARSLRCLLRQTAVSRLEILLADLAPGSETIDGAAEQPGIGGATALCAFAATTPFVAFIEDHCYAEPEGPWGQGPWGQTVNCRSTEHARKLGNLKVRQFTV